MKKAHHHRLIWIFCSIFPLFTLSSNEKLIPRVSEQEAQIELLPDTINSPFMDYAPWVNEADDLLFFESDRPQGVGLNGDFDIWVSSRLIGPDGKTTDFANAVNLGKPVNSALFEGYPVLRKNSSDEWEIIFSAEPRPDSGDPQGTNLYTARQLNGIWQEPKPLIELNTDFHDRMPAISPDGKLLLFSSDRPGGFGKDDLYVAEYDSDQGYWTNVQNIGSQFNGPQSEISPTIHKDGVTIFFSSNKPGGVGSYDLYFSQMPSVDERPLRFKDPMNLGLPYNSPEDDEFCSVMSNGSHFYFASNRPGGYGGFDIYKAKMPEYAKTRAIITYTGRIYDRISGKGVEANIMAIADARQQNLATRLPNGDYQIAFLNNQVIQVNISAPGYLPYQAILDLRDMHSKRTINRDFPLERQRSLPDEYTIAFEFTHSVSGEVLKPAVTYRLLPESIQENIMELKNGLFEIKVPAGSRFTQMVEFDQYLKRSNLQVIATLPKFKDQNYTRSLRTIIDPGNPKVPEKIKISLPMIPSIAKEEVVQINQNPETNKVATVMFPYNVSDMLVSGSMDALLEIINIWNSKKQPLIILEGHTDSSGSPEYNLELSEKRAKFVREQLMLRGVPAEKIKTSWFGATKPIATETTEEGKAKNRRVELFFEQKVK